MEQTRFKRAYQAPDLDAIEMISLQNVICQSLNGDNEGFTEDPFTM